MGCEARKVQLDEVGPGAESLQMWEYIGISSYSVVLTSKSAHIQFKCEELNLNQPIVNEGFVLALSSISYCMKV